MRKSIGPKNTPKVVKWCIATQETEHIVIQQQMNYEFKLFEVNYMNSILLLYNYLVLATMSPNK